MLHQARLPHWGDAATAAAGYNPCPGSNHQAITCPMGELQAVPNTHSDQEAVFICFADKARNRLLTQLAHNHATCMWTNRSGDEALRCRIAHTSMNQEIQGCPKKSGDPFRCSRRFLGSPKRVPDTTSRELRESTSRRHTYLISDAQEAKKADGTLEVYTLRP